jgi:hypothetical protein
MNELEKIPRPVVQLVFRRLLFMADPPDAKPGVYFLKLFKDVLRRLHRNTFPMRKVVSFTRS